MTDAQGSAERNETPTERADRNLTDILQELRVVLTGTQLISGFLLAVAFQTRFPELDDGEVVFYLILVAMAGVATLLGLTPAMVHRLHFRRHVKPAVVGMANVLLICTLVVVSLLMIGVTSFIFQFVLSPAAGLWAAGIACVGVISLWVLAGAGAGRRRDRRSR